jgi:hypothetical protein
MSLGLGEAVVFVLVVVVVQPAINSEAIAIRTTSIATFRVTTWPSNVVVFFLDVNQMIYMAKRRLKHS